MALFILCLAFIACEEVDEDADNKNDKANDSQENNSSPVDPTDNLPSGTYISTQVTVDGESFALVEETVLRLFPYTNLLFHLNYRMSIILKAGLGIHTNQKVFKRTSDISTIFRTPYLDGSIMLGIIFNLN